MNGGTAFVGVRAEDIEDAAAPPARAPEPLPLPEGVEPEPALRRAAPVLALAAAAAWVAVMTWLARHDPALATPVGLVRFAAALTAVPLLIGVVWLVLARADGSYTRLVRGAREVRGETELLARTVALLSDAIETRRGMLADQVRSLSAIGDGASARLATIGRGLSEEIDQADIHARALGEAAGAAEAKLAVLLAGLPPAQEDVARLGASIESAGLAAGAQAAALDAQVVALTARGREAETVASGAAQKLAAHIARMDASGEAAGRKLEAVAAEVAGEIDALLDRTATAVDESRKGIAAQGEAMLAMVRANQVALDTSARESAEALAERIDIVELVIDRVAQRLKAQRDAGDAMATALDAWMARAELRFAALRDDGTRRVEEAGAAVAMLGERAAAITEALRTGEAVAATAIATAETLLIALDSAAREMDETLPGALGRLDERVDATRARVAGVRPDLLALVTASESTHDAVEAVAGELAEQRREAETVARTLGETLNGALDAGRTKVAGLDAGVDAATARVERFVEEAAPRLLEALLRVRETAGAAADSARQTLAAVIPEAAEALEEAGRHALARAAGSTVETQIASLTEITTAAVGAAMRAVDRLDAQLARLDERSHLVETRFAELKDERDGAEQQSFARRASVLVEALNSASIDITRRLAPEVADNAWAAYLKGDRGVFTRRAVRLLDADEQQMVARLYDAEDSFRDQVNRYVHDFEAMLRAVLSHGDASPLGVALLSSDTGKLYVALAQAIERLR